MAEEVSRVLLRDIATRALSELDELRDFLFVTEQAYEALLAPFTAPKSSDNDSRPEVSEELIDTFVDRAEFLRERYLNADIFFRELGVLERFVRESLAAIYRENPSRFLKPSARDERKIPLSDVLRINGVGGTLDDLIGEVIERRVRDLMYERPRKWFDELTSLTGHVIPDEILSAYIEAKATRDALVHGDGTAGSDYVGLAGNSARVREGETLEVPADYGRETAKTIRTIIKLVAPTPADSTDISLAARSSS